MKMQRKKCKKKYCFKLTGFVDKKSPPRCKRRHRRSKRKSSKIRFRPMIQRYFFIPSIDVTLSEEWRLSAGQFTDDSGKTIERFQSVGKKGYYNLFINGVIQAGGLFDVSKDALYIKRTGTTILAGTPIIIESIKIKAYIV